MKDGMPCTSRYFSTLKASAIQISSQIRILDNLIEYRSYQ